MLISFFLPLNTDVVPKIQEPAVISVAKKGAIVAKTRSGAATRIIYVATIPISNVVPRIILAAQKLKAVAPTTRFAVPEDVSYPSTFLF
jgi:hypothetical protein